MSAARAPGRRRFAHAGWILLALAGAAAGCSRDVEVLGAAGDAAVVVAPGDATTGDRETGGGTGGTGDDGGTGGTGGMISGGAGGVIGDAALPTDGGGGAGAPGDAASTPDGISDAGRADGDDGGARPGDAADANPPSDATGGDATDVKPPPPADAASADAADVGAPRDAPAGDAADGGAPPGDAAPDLIGPPGDAGSGDVADAAAGDAPPPGDAASSCTGIGDSIRFTSQGAATCASVLGAASHRYAVCSCATMNLSQRLRGDSFDSANTGGAALSALGIDGDLISAAEVRMDGAVHVAGGGGAQCSDHLEAGASLRVGGPLMMLNSDTRARADAYVNGDITGQVRADGTLHVPASATLGPDVQASTVVREPVTVAAPCDCGAGFVDLAGAISAATNRNDDAVIGLSPGRLAASTTAATLDLPCGTFLLSSIHAAAGVTLAVHGRAALVVAGDVMLQGGLAVALDPGAELDLVIAGGLGVSGGGTVGDIAAPARFRIWIAGSQPVTLDGPPVLGAVIHAAQAAVSAPAGFELYGGLLCQSLSSGGEIQVHYDRAILAGGAPCGVAAPGPVL